MNVFLVTAVLSLSLAQPGILAAPEPSKEVAAICFKSGEQTSGMNKICYYDCMGSAKAITIGAANLCPLSIND